MLEHPSAHRFGAVLACPACGEPLVHADRTFRCDRGHAFDEAREGYVNLLAPQHRRSKDPGYSSDMIAGRRDFFDAGHYQSLADDVAALVAGYLPTGETPRLVLDAGCGEGYYLRRLRARLDTESPAAGTVLCGLDISKHAVRVAARRDPQGLYAVAGTFRMPVLPERVDVLLTHFSPVSPVDFRRVLRPDGIVLVGGPGARHLFGLKQLLYDTPAPHEPADALAGAAGFSLTATHHIRHPLSLRGPGQVANLVRMTPYAWAADAAKQARLAGLDALDTEIDVVVRAYRLTEPAAEPPASNRG